VMLLVEGSTSPLQYFAAVQRVSAQAVTPGLPTVSVLPLRLSSASPSFPVSLLFRS
jgi:hypothetical protein